MGKIYDFRHKNIIIPSIAMPYIVVSKKWVFFKENCCGGGGEGGREGGTGESPLEAIYSPEVQLFYIIYRCGSIT